MLDATRSEIKKSIIIKKIYIIFAFVLGPLWGACGALAQLPATSAPVSGKLLITGSSTMFSLVTEMARRFEKLHPAVRIEVRSGGSGKGIADLRAGVSDIGMASRPLLEAEKDLYAFPIARDGVAIVVHRDNPVKDMTTPQLVDLLAGKANNWKMLGGRDAPVKFIWRGRGQGTSEMILEHLDLKHEQIHSHAIIIDNQEVIKAVAAEQHAVSPISVGESERWALAGVPIRALAYNKIAASSRSIRNGSYALARPLTLVTRRLPAGLARQFIDYALSSHVADLYPKFDFVPYQE